MAALCNRASHYIFALWFLFLSSFFPRLTSAVADWMSAIPLHMQDPKKSPKIRLLGTIVQLCRAISLVVGVSQTLRR